MMVHLYRKVLVSLVAVVALGAVGAGSASAAAWHVGGSELVGSANLAEATVVVENFTMSYESIGVEVECTGLRAKEAKLASPSTGKAASLVFTGCRVTSGGVCRLESEEIKSKPLNLSAALGAGKGVNLKLAPEKGTVFMTYSFTGTGCTLAGVNTVQGKANVVLAAAQEERAEQELVVNTGAGELEAPFGVTLKGKAKLKLGSGGAWSFH